MNYRDFFKNKKTTVKDVIRLLPEGVDKSEFNKGITIENRQTKDIFIAAKLASKNLSEDAHYYSKIYENNDEDEKQFQKHADKEGSGVGNDNPEGCYFCGSQGHHSGECPKRDETLKSDDGVDEHCGACEDDLGGEEELGNEYDDNGGLPKIGGALAVHHLGQPIMMGKIIQVGNELGNGPASGELSGMTNSTGRGVTKDQGGIPANQPSDKETITAGGKPVDSSIASKSVGGSVVPGEGQRQGGPNSQGTIASTNKLSESKNKVRKIVKKVLKEIKYNKLSGKWVKINEDKTFDPPLYGPSKYVGAKDKSRCKSCGKVLKSLGGTCKCGDKIQKANEEVNMKMGPSYKTVQPRQYKTSEDDFARTNQYEPEISEMYDDEEECMMNERYVELANQQRNLSEAELTELKTLREKIDNIAVSKRNFGASQGGVEPNLYEKKNVDENRCEDYPCCGHGDGGCPNSDGSFNCVFCGRKLPKNARSSMCSGCQKRMHDLDDNDPTGQDSENAFGGGEYQMEETVDMKMGPSYKVVQPTLVKTSDDDFARTNQYNPEISEAGGGAVQHSSYRTVDNGNLPQDPETRWKNSVDEGEKSKSKVHKTIQKGQKPDTSTNVQDLKHQKPKKTSTGVHKRKP